MIALIGFPGSGKSTLGNELSRRYGLPCFDVDEAIERYAGKSVATLFREAGETVFRDMEERFIADRLRSGGVGVLVTGGGAVLRSATKKNLIANSFVVHVFAPLDTILHRTREDATRPLFAGPDRVRTVSKLFEERRGVYDFAHVAVDGRRAREKADEVLGAWLDFSYRRLR